MSRAPLPIPSAEDWARLGHLQSRTRRHRASHGCGAYTFEDGPGLARIVRQASPRRILELGTALGYTSAVLALSCPDAEVHTVEGDPTHVALARSEITMLGLAHRITVHPGDFAEVLPGLAKPFDLAFFDGFAPDPNIIGQLCDLVAAGGWLICANLGLAGSSGLRDLDAVLAGRWFRAEDLEGGGTAVFRSST